MFRIRRFSVISTANTVAYFIGFLIILIPLVLIFTALFCLLYNLTARFTGGIGVDVQARTPAVAAAPPPASHPPQQAQGG